MLCRDDLSEYCAPKARRGRNVGWRAADVWHPARAFISASSSAERGCTAASTAIPTCSSASSRRSGTRSGSTSDMPARSRAGRLGAAADRAAAVIMVRGDDERHQRLFNRCRHRGNLVCQRERSQRRASAARITAGPTRDRASFSSRPSRKAMTSTCTRKISRSRRCRGSAPIAAWSSRASARIGITLDEHLGPVKEYIDLFLDLSPTGEMRPRYRRCRS